MENKMITHPPILAYIGKISDKPNWSFPSHKHDDLSEIIYIFGGEGEFRIDGQPFTAKKGDMLIYNKGVLHEERSSAVHPLKAFYCGVSNLKIEGFPDGFVLPTGVSPHIERNKYSDKVETLFSMIFEESTIQAQGHKTISENFLTSIILLIQRMVQLDNINPTKSDTVVLALQIKEYLDKNYHKHLTLNEIAREFHMNPYYLSHVFNDMYNDSPINYLISRRMGEGKRLLINTNMKVREIASLLGYENPNYFTRIFTKTMGESPLQFKRSETKERLDMNGKT
ncbi:AraC family transcriptional regulator [Halalkalibacter flavus]|uniref:AraC family transcriptional regulator n=1 Tax=Halalkalibacter flavus TaxID=3090668 RepID=UPI002FC963D9